jgi:hypothetical protein
MDVTANLVTATQLTAWMQAANGSATANQDQWCYAMNAITGTPCPAYDVGNPPTVKTDAQTFLDGLRSYQLGTNAATQQPGGATLNGNAGGTSMPGPVAAAVAPTGMGLLGPTNCAFCQWLAKNPLFLVAGAIGIYFAFFYKKG